MLSNEALRDMMLTEFLSEVQTEREFWERTASWFRCSSKEFDKNHLFFRFIQVNKENFAEF